MSINIAPSNPFERLPKKQNHDQRPYSRLNIILKKQSLLLRQDVSKLKQLFEQSWYWNSFQPPALKKRTASSVVEESKTVDMHRVYGNGPKQGHEKTMS